MRVKKINKTNEIEKHLLRYKSIDRMTAAQLFRCFDLPDVIRRLRKRHTIETLTEYNANTKYQIIE